MYGQRGNSIRKVRITEICNATGLSRSTVDRMLNGRGQVHPRTVETIRQTIRQLCEPSQKMAPAPEVPVDILLRLGSDMMHQMMQAFDAMKGPRDKCYDLFQMNEETVLRQLREVCSNTDRVAIVAVKDTDRVRSLLARSRNSGKKIIAVISELGPESRDGFVGIDNKAAGATAAYLISKAIGDRPATVGVVVGDTAFRCHEDREIGFRTTLRMIAQLVVLAGEARGEDNPERTYYAVRSMLRAHPGIGAIYNVSGGNVGLVRALEELGREQDIIVVSHELTDATVPLLQDNTLNYMFSQDPRILLSEAMDLARSTKFGAGFGKQIDFGVYTRYNLPRYARDLHP